MNSVPRYPDGLFNSVLEWAGTPATAATAMNAVEELFSPARRALR
jgi:hypothetical protein